MSKRAAAQASTEDGLHLFTYKEAAQYLGPSFTARWVKRQVLDFKTIKAIRLTTGRTVIAKSELDRYVAEHIAKASR
jgi:hypothetical protein